MAILFLRVVFGSSGGLFSRSFSPVQRLAPRLGLFRSAKGGDHAETALKSAREQSPGASSLRLAILVGLFLALGTLSLVVAPEPSFGIRKLLYLANIFALFFVIREVVRDKQDFVDVLIYTFAGSVFTLLMGYAQFLTILFVP